MDMEKIILRSTGYPKKGSDEWILSDDSIEFRVIEKEKKNQTHPRNAITASQFDSQRGWLRLYIDVGRKYKALQRIFFAPESLAVAQKMHELLDSEAEHRFNERNQRNYIGIERDNEVVKRSMEAIKILEETSDVLDALEKYTAHDVFTEQELLEINELKRYGIDIKAQKTEILEKGTALQKELTYHIKQHTALIKRGIRDDDSKMLEVDKQIDDLDKQIYDVNEQVFALDDKNVIQLEKLRKWLELGQQRTK